MNIYDEIDLRNAKNIGFWTGAISTFVGTLILFAAIGLYLNS